MEHTLTKKATTICNLYTNFQHMFTFYQAKSACFSLLACIRSPVLPANLVNTAASACSCSPTACVVYIHFVITSTAIWDCNELPATLAHDL